MEIADILSDSESVDRLVDSDDEEDGTVERAIEDVSDNDADESEDEEDHSGDIVWRREPLNRADTPFTADFGPDISDNVRTPKDIFLCLFPEDLIDLIVEQTNIYILQKNKNETLITRDELQIFLGINIMMGVKKLPSYRDYWSLDPKLNDPYISSLMTVTRFGFILGNLHISDNSTEPKKGDQNYDKLYKLRPLLDRLGETFKAHWKPSKYQSIDESMVKFKGRSSLRQYMPAKPIKRGYKVWERADESGYVCEFQIYTGKTKNPEKNLGARVVKDLTRELVGKNHHVCFDNFFTGVDLLESLKKENIFACGTVRSNRTRLPKTVIPDKQMKHGQYDFQTSNTGIRYIKWMDKKGVYFLSNYHDPCEMTTVNRRQKDGTLKQIDSPVMCSDYNKYMGFVDKADHLLSTYKIDRKSKKWWHRLFWHFIDLSITNSFIIFLKISNDESITLKKFRLALVDQLVAHKIPSKKGRKRQTMSVGPQKPQVPVEKRRSQSAHMPVYIDKKKRCALCSNKENEKRSQWVCNICDVGLCLQPNRNCFSAYHS